MQLFRTGLISSDVPEDVELPWFKARGWQIVFVEERFVGQTATHPGRTSPYTRTFSMWVDDITNKRLKAVDQRPMLVPTSYGAHAGTEIFVRAKDRAAAQRAMDLILLSLVLQDPEQICVGHEINRRIYPSGVHDRVPQDDHLPPLHMMGSGLTASALMAARLSQRKLWQTAAWRLYYSLDQHYSCWKDTHPNLSYYKPLSDDPKEFLVYANCIHLAYAALEDLGLQVNASAKKPSILPGNVKNPIVWDDLRTRLLRAKVKPDRKVVWKSRASSTRITRARKVAGHKAAWAGGDVYDKMLPTLDAIFALSFLRSKAAAHGNLTFARSLSIYDVENSQHLARSILMQAIGVG